MGRDTMSPLATLLTLLYTSYRMELYGVRGRCVLTVANETRISKYIFFLIDCR